MDDAARKAAERVAQFYFHSEADFGLLGETDDPTWDEIVFELDDPGRGWFLTLNDAVRDLARALWHAGTPVDVTGGDHPLAWSDEAERRAAAVSRLWPGGCWDEVELGISDNGSRREWFQALADAVRDLHEKLGPAN